MNYSTSSHQVVESNDSAMPVKTIQARHLLSINDLSVDEIMLILETAEAMKETLVTVDME